MTSLESQLEEQFIQKPRSLKYDVFTDIRIRATLEANFRQHFEALNRVKFTAADFADRYLVQHTHDQTIRSCNALQSAA